MFPFEEGDIFRLSGRVRIIGESIPILECFQCRGHE